MALLAGWVGLTDLAQAADDTARFNGTWEATFPYDGQLITMISVHEGSTFKNYVVLPTGNTPAGDGSFSAANGRYTTSADKPNDSGTYHFIGNNIVVCTNAAGQTLTWKRSNVSVPHDAPAAPAATVAPDPSLPPETNAAIAAFNRKDYNTAWRDFMAAAQKGDSEAQAGIGAMLFTKINPPGTGYWAQCEKWLLLSAKQGNVKGMTFLGKYYYADAVNIAGGINPGINNAPIPPALRAQAERRFAQAREWFEQAAAKNDGYAMANLAIMLDAGVGGPRDPNRAAQLRSGVSAHSDPGFAARATSDPANLAMTAAWQAGHYQEALKTAYVQAANGNAAAQAMIGRSYYTGLGATQSYSAALPWFNKAAAQKNPDALFFLGLMYEWGHGVNQDLQKAVTLLDQAAALGQRYAEMEAKGMRMEGAAAAQQARFAAVCRSAGGVADGPVCSRGGLAIDPY